MAKDWLRLLRAPLSPTAALDVLSCTLLALGAARGRAPALTPGEAAALAGTALLIYAFGMGLNDWADRHRDRALAPDRPLPSGRLRPGPVLALLVLLALGALALGGGPAGDRGVVLAALASAGLYDLGLKARLVPGALSLGLARALSASQAVLPLVLVGLAPAWTLAGPLVVGTYAAGVTVLSTTEEQAVPGRVLTARGLAAAAFAGAALLACLAAGRLTLATVLASGSVLSLLFGRVPRPGPVKRQVLEMLLGLYLLAATLAGGSGSLPIEALAIAVAFALIYLSQVAVRALRLPTPVSSAGGAPTPSP